MFRLVDAFAAVVVPEGLHELLASAPLRIYERNCWTGALDLGEKPAPILKACGPLMIVKLSLKEGIFSWNLSPVLLDPPKLAAP